MLGLHELPDEALAEHSDEPFHVDRPQRAVLLREVLAEQLRDPSRDAEARYDAVVADLELRGQFPVGVFGEAARAATTSRSSRAGAPSSARSRSAAATRIAFGRASSPHAQLLPALELELSGGRTVRLVGQTELLLDGDRRTSVIGIIGKAEKRSRHHLRGALDHVVLAAAGLAPAGHAHVLLGPRRQGLLRVEHAAWTPDAARAYLADLARELLDAPARLSAAVRRAGRRARRRSRSPRTRGDPTTGLGYGPIQRRDGLDAARRSRVAIALRRLRPLVERMRGEHGFERRTR